MVVHSARRFICLLVGAALALVTVWMGGGLNTALMASHPAATAVTSDMKCSGCETMKVSVAACAQMPCVNLAAAGERGTFIGTTGHTFFQVTGLVPDEITSTPPTPPI